MTVVQYIPESSEVRKNILSFISFIKDLISPFRCSLETEEADNALMIKFNGPEKFDALVLLMLHSFADGFKWDYDLFQEVINKDLTFNWAFARLPFSQFCLWVPTKLLQDRKILAFTIADYAYCDYLFADCKSDRPIYRCYQEITIGHDEYELCGIDVCLTYYLFREIDKRTTFKYIQPRPRRLLMDHIIKKIYPEYFTGFRFQKGEIVTALLSYLIKKAERVQITNQQIKITEPRFMADYEMREIMDWHPFRCALHVIALHIFAFLDQQEHNQLRKLILTEKENKHEILNAIAAFDYCFGTNYFPEYYLYSKVAQSKKLPSA
jgi:hypothetical protein